MSTGRKEWLDTEGNPIAGQPDLPDGKELLVILKKHPQDCTEGERSSLFLLANLALPIINTNFGNKAHRDMMWQKFTPSDITWCLYSFQCRAMADVPVGAVNASGTGPVLSDMSTDSSNRTPKGNMSRRENKRRKVCTGNDKRTSVMFYFETKVTVEDFMATDDGKRVMAAWGEEIKKKDRTERVQNRENVQPSTATAMEQGEQFRNCVGLEFLFTGNAVSI